MTEEDVTQLMDGMMNRLNTVSLFAVALGFASARGDIVAQFDVGSSGTNSSDQAGFVQTGWADVNLSNAAAGVTQNGITLTIGAAANESRNRTGPFIAENPLVNVFRDFLFTRPEDGAVPVTFSGLLPNTLYEITGFAYDSSGGNNETGYWYLGSVAPENLQHTWTSSIATLDDPGDIFLLTGTSDSSGTLTYLLTTDNTSRINGFIVNNPSKVAPFAVTSISYDPETDNATLTWRKSGAASYTVRYSLDLSDWTSDIADGLTAELDDENPDDSDHITKTFNLSEISLEDNVTLADQVRVFFRVEED